MQIVNGSSQLSLLSTLHYKHTFGFVSETTEDDGISNGDDAKHVDESENSDSQQNIEEKWRIELFQVRRLAYLFHVHTIYTCIHFTYRSLINAYIHTLIHKK